jgi:hypothetical protein
MKQERILGKEDDRNVMAEGSKGKQCFLEAGKTSALEKAGGSWERITQVLDLGVFI